MTYSKCSDAEMSDKLFYWSVIFIFTNESCLFYEDKLGDFLLTKIYVSAYGMKHDGSLLTFAVRVQIKCFIKLLHFII